MKEKNNLSEKELDSLARNFLASYLEANATASQIGVVGNTKVFRPVINPAKVTPEVASVVAAYVTMRSQEKLNRQILYLQIWLAVISTISVAIVLLVH